MAAPLGNQYAKGNDGGRPLLFQTVEELDKAIESYFTKCEEEKEIPTITGLALHLNTSRKTIVEYKEREEFRNSIKRAKDICESYIEKGAMSNKLNTAFSIFNLKNNYGWVDKQEVDQRNTNLNLNKDVGEMTDDELRQLANS